VAVDDASVSAEHVRVPYDAAETAEAIVAAGLPSDFANHVLSGRAH
jgi:hypothetical protein